MTSRLLWLLLFAFAVSAPELAAQTAPATQQAPAEPQAPPAQTPAAPAAPSTPPPALDPATVIPLDPKVVHGELASGIDYYIRANQEPRNRAELRLVVNAGSILESEDQLGVAHFVEHMAFNGTEHFDSQELVNYLESLGMRFGADVNAYTSFDETVYMLTVPTDAESVLAKAFLVLADWARGSTFDAVEVNKERGVVIEEWRMGRGAGQRLREKHLPVLLHGSLYADRIPIGTKQVLDTFPPEAAKRFVRDWYRPELMAVVAVGDFDPARIETLLRQHFDGFKASAQPVQRPVFPVPAHPETLITIASDIEATATTAAVIAKFPRREQETVGPTGAPSSRDSTAACSTCVFSN